MKLEKNIIHYFSSLIPYQNQFKKLEKASDGKLNVFYLLFFILIFSQCSNPNATKFPDSEILPIDGTWGESSPGKDNKYRLDKGKLYFLEGSAGFLVKKEAIILVNIKHYKDDIYYCNWVPDFYSKCTLKVSNGRLVIKPIKGISPGFGLYKISLLNEHAFFVAHEQDFTIEKIIMTEETVEVDVQNQYVDPGSKLSIERERTITHSVALEESVLESTSTSKDLELPILNLFEGQIEKSILKEIERQTSRKFETQETFRAKIELDGNIGSTWKISWHDRVKKGIINCLSKNGKPFSVSFEFPMSSEIRAVNVKN